MKIDNESFHNIQVIRDGLQQLINSEDQENAEMLKTFVKYAEKDLKNEVNLEESSEQSNDDLGVSDVKSTESLCHSDGEFDVDMDMNDIFIDAEVDDKFQTILDSCSCYFKCVSGPDYFLKVFYIPCILPKKI